MRSLEKNPARRFQTAEEMARALGYSAPMHYEGGQALGTDSAIARPKDYGPFGPPGQLKLVRFDNAVIPLNIGVTPLNRRDVNSADGEISREHAQVTYRAGTWWVQDVGSTYGTYVNTLRIFEPVMLQPGDRIQMGRTVLHVAE